MGHRGAGKLKDVSEFRGAQRRHSAIERTWCCPLSLASSAISIRIGKG
jgi:hypothetical protein